MIDWFNIAGNALLVLGCAIALAALSYASWQAHLYHENWIARLGHPSIEAFLYLAGLLFCSGMGIIARSRLEQVLWLLLALTFVAQLLILRRSR